MSVRSAAIALLAVLGCQSGQSGGPAPKGKEAPSGDGWKATAYGRDIDRLCNAEKYSGALDQPPEARPMLVAQWLGPNLETQDAHAFLVKIQPMGAADKSVALDGEAFKVGLTGCPLARSWKK